MTGSEELLKLRKKLGEEKFEMAIQMYNYFEDVLGKLAVEGEGASATTNDEQTNHPLRVHTIVVSTQHDRCSRAACGSGTSPPILTEPVAGEGMQRRCTAKDRLPYRRPSPYRRLRRTDRPDE